MITTPREKNAILVDAKNLVRMAIVGQKRFMTREDYEELESDCLMAASRAIDDYDPSIGCRLSSFMYRYIIQKRIKVLRHRARRSLEIHDTESLETSMDGECSGGVSSKNSAHHAAMIQNMEIIIDRARNDGVLTEREYMVLVARRGNVIQPVIAQELGLSFQRVGQIEAEAVEKIKRVYRTAE
jgi:RNA polymerase sigma factor (sigma-70 family)